MALSSGHSVAAPLFVLSLRSIYIQTRRHTHNLRTPHRVRDRPPVSVLDSWALPCDSILTTGVQHCCASLCMARGRTVCRPALPSVSSVAAMPKYVAIQRAASRTIELRPGVPRVEAFGPTAILAAHPVLSWIGGNATVAVVGKGHAAPLCPPSGLGASPFATGATNAGGENVSWRACRVPPAEERTPLEGDLAGVSPPKALEMSTRWGFVCRSGARAAAAATEAGRTAGRAWSVAAVDDGRSSGCKRFDEPRELRRPWASSFSQRCVSQSCGWRDGAASGEAGGRGGASDSSGRKTGEVRGLVAGGAMPPGEAPRGVQA